MCVCGRTQSCQPPATNTSGSYGARFLSLSATLGESFHHEKTLRGEGGGVCTPCHSPGTRPVNVLQSAWAAQAERAPQPGPAVCAPPEGTSRPGAQPPLPGAALHAHARSESSAC